MTALTKIRQMWGALTKRSTPGTANTSTLFNPAPWLLSALDVEPTASGVAVDGLSALRSSTVYACVRVLSEAVAQLPLYLYQRTGDRTRRAVNHPLYQLLNFRPNRLQTSYEFRQLLMTWCLLFGNAYIEITRDSKTGAPNGLWPLLPQRMVLLYKDGELHYTWSLPGGPLFHIDSANMLHIRSLSTDGLAGISAIACAKQQIGLDIVTGRYAQEYFGRGPRLSGTLETPNILGDEAIRNLKESFKKMYTSPSAFHDVLVLEEGLKFCPYQLRNDEAQFLESRKFSVEDICRIYRVPPYMVGALDKTNYSNVDALARDFVSNTLTPWLVNFEQSYALHLLKPEEWPSYFVQHDMTATLRGDHESRMRGYSVGISSGIYSPNDCRKLESLDPRDGGDVYLQPVNLAPSPFNPAAEPVQKKENLV